MQPVFQDPYGSLDPVLPVERAGVFETNDILAAVELVRADLGVTIFPATMAAMFPDLRTVALRRAPTWTAGVLHRRGPLVPAAAALLEHLVSRVGSRG
jgi:DNA-binding transcriptional LysR family regulator